MKFYRNLYISETVKNPSGVKWKLKHHAGVQVYIISIANGADQLEIMHSAYLKQKYFRYHPPIIVGITSTYDEAVQMIVELAKECVTETGSCNIKEFLKKKTKQKRSSGASV